MMAVRCLDVRQCFCSPHHLRAAAEELNREGSNKKMTVEQDFEAVDQFLVGMRVLAVDDDKTCLRDVVVYEYFSATKASEIAKQRLRYVLHLVPTQIKKKTKSRNCLLFGLEGCSSSQFDKEASREMARESLYVLRYGFGQTFRGPVRAGHARYNPLDD
ncbi:hypothetical protein YC2023_016605 [Brassica napus]